MSPQSVNDEEWAHRVRDSLARQQIMSMLGVTLEQLEPGDVELQMPFRNSLSQQHGFIHAGVVATLIDTACGYAALSLMPAGAGVLTVEYKINLLAPAKGDLLRARGQVLRAGRTLTVCQGSAHVRTQEEVRLVAHMVATMAVIRGNEHIAW